MNTLQVAVLGIDGSGKSSLAQALPVVLAAELGLVAGSAGEDFWVYGPDQDHLAPHFHPRGFPLAARLSRLARSAAKRAARSGSRLYPFFKLAHMLFQDDAAVAIGRRYGAAVMAGDGNLILSATGRAGNYRARPRERATVDDVEAAYRLLLEGKPLPTEAARRLPALNTAARVARWLRRIGFDGVWLPDAVIFLDLPPATALDRIGHRGTGVDAHENLADMTHARESYVKAMAAYELITGVEGCVIDASEATPGDILRQAVDHLRPQLRAAVAAAAAARDDVLGTSRQATARIALNPVYIFGYLLKRFFQNAWRELTFPASAPGRALLREGYSAGVMRIIYEQDGRRQPLLNRVFFGYPLHRAVYDRLQILTRVIEPRLRGHLQNHKRIRVFSAPSGFAYDLLRPLSRMPELAQHVRLVAADLDPHGALAPELTERAQQLGLGRFQMILGDITAAAVKTEIAAGGPYDLALFVGLSSWLPKAPTVEHLKWLRGHLAKDAVLVTDCFSADTYAEGGRLAGYKASYYSPTAYQALLEWCGYAGLEAAPASGRDRINHVFVTRVRAPRQTDPTWPPPSTSSRSAPSSRAPATPPT